jgi:FkbM family methyltransferase
MGVSAIDLLRQFLGGGFRRLANEIIPEGPSGRSVQVALRRIARRRDIRTVIDVGASDGRWSAAARCFFQRARYLLVEAQALPHEAELRSLKARHPEFDYVIAAAGPREGTIHFDASDPFGGMASERPFVADDVSVPMTTVDAEVSRRRLEGPFLVKLDTHGYEVPILEGATNTLRDTHILVIEAYNFKTSATCLRFHELCAWIEERGFRCIDLCDVLHRPHDGALWQMDLLFLPSDSPEFESSSYATLAAASLRSTQRQS